MKYFVASDVHGSAYWAELMRKAFVDEKAERIILLGDLLYHGPRNDLPDEYNPKKVIEILNGMADKIIAVRGNCDAEVDQMVLKFPIMAEYALLDCLSQGEHAGCLIAATHGHIFNLDNPLPFAASRSDGKKNIMLCGHTHVPCVVEKDNFVYMNPGSVAIPKEGSCHSYMVIEGGQFIWKNLADGKVYKIW